MHENAILYMHLLNNVTLAAKWLHREKEVRGRGRDREREREQEKGKETVSKIKAINLKNQWIVHIEAYIIAKWL